jgi:hypothetical protein
MNLSAFLFFKEPTIELDQNQGSGLIPELLAKVISSVIPAKAGI